MIIIAHPTAAGKGGANMKTTDKLCAIEEVRARNEEHEAQSADAETEIRIWCHGGRRELEIFYTADLVLRFFETNISVNIGSITIGERRNYYNAVEAALLFVRPLVAESDAMTGTHTAIYAADDTGYREWIGGAMPKWEGVSA